MSSATVVRSDEVLETVGLTDAARQPIGTSGGCEAGGRAGDPQPAPILLLDEPVSSLDPEGRVDLLAVLRGLGGSSTVLFSTHILTDVERVCDRVAILDHGRLVTTGPMTELLERYARPVYRLEPEDGQAVAMSRLLASLRAAPFVTHVDETTAGLRVAVADAADAGHQLLAMVAAHGVALLVFERRPALGDVFLQWWAQAHERKAARDQSRPDAAQALERWRTRRMLVVAVVFTALIGSRCWRGTPELVKALVNDQFRSTCRRQRRRSVQFLKNHGQAGC
jgi:ABC-type multidrug transport system ATPase subunit